MSLKEQVHELADQLAEGATWEDVAYEVYVRQSIERGVEASEAGRLVPADQAKAYLNELLAQNAGSLDNRRA